MAGSHWIPKGPFEIYDTVVGFGVASHIGSASPNPAQRAFAKLLKSKITEGKTGIGSGEGFYVYDAEGESLGPAEGWELPEA